MKISVEMQCVQPEYTNMRKEMSLQSTDVLSTRRTSKNYSVKFGKIITANVTSADAVN